MKGRHHTPEQIVRKLREAAVRGQCCNVKASRSTASGCSGCGLQKVCGYPRSGSSGAGSEAARHRPTGWSPRTGITCGAGLSLRRHQRRAGDEGAQHVRRVHASASAIAWRGPSVPTMSATCSTTRLHTVDVPTTSAATTGSGQVRRSSSSGTPRPDRMHHVIRKSRAAGTSSIRTIGMTCFSRSCGANYRQCLVDFAKSMGVKIMFSRR